MGSFISSSHGVWHSLMYGTPIQCQALERSLWQLMSSIPWAWDARM